MEAKNCLKKNVRGALEKLDTVSKSNADHRPTGLTIF